MPRGTRVVNGATRPRAPAITLEEREDQLIARAVDLAEKQLSEGTASSQVIVHYLKLGSTRERLERERLQSENALLRQKTEALQSAKNIEGLYSDAIRAMKTYSGSSQGDEEDED